MKYDADPSRLCIAVYRAGLALAQPRRNRLALVELFVGPRYSENGANKLQPINLLSLYVNVVSRQLVSKAPRAMLSTFNKQYRHIVDAEQSWLNREIEKQNMAGTFQRAVLDALFCMGIVKVGIASPGTSAQLGWEVKAGEPYAESIDFDDFVFDLHARKWEDASFQGHRVRYPLAAVKEDKNYSRERKKLAASTDAIYNQQGIQYVSVIGRTTYQASEEEFEDHVNLWEIWCPRHRCVYTFVDDDGAPGLCEDGEPLREQDWIGPDRGPYHVIGYGVVPGNLLPKAPLQDLADLHVFVNGLYRKLMDQANRQKTITLVRGAADADGKRQIDASDGEAVRCDDPASAKELTMGGPAQQNFGLFVDAIQRFNYVAGNIESAGGLSPQSKTATQDKMLEASASGAISDKQDYTLNFVSDVLNTCCWFHHHHPTKTMKTPLTIPGMPDMPSITRTVTPQQRASVPWEDMEVKVDPYSLRHSTPESRAKDLQDIVTQMIMPMMQALQAQGIQVDMNFLLGKIGEYRDMPDLSSLVTLRDPPSDPAAGTGGAESAGPSETTRNYVRESTSSRTPGATDRGLAGTLMSGKEMGGSPETNGAMQ